MIRRPMCLLCFLMMLVLGIADLAGIPLIRGNPFLPVCSPGSKHIQVPKSAGRWNGTKTQNSPSLFI